MTRQIALYSAVHDTLTRYGVGIDEPSLIKRSDMKMRAKVQYAWPDRARKFLYVSTSNGGPKLKSDFNHVSAFAIGDDGQLTEHGEPKPLTRRAVHMCLDPSGRYALNAHNSPTSGITVHRIQNDGAVGQEIAQHHALDYGNYPHQVMVFPSGRTALIVDRGVAAKQDRPESPGALRSFVFTDGVLSPGQVIAPHGGYGFGPRHIVFHPAKPWIYVSDERTNRLYMFRHVDDRIEPQPAFTRELLANPRDVRPRQLAGPIHFHPHRPVLYVANRSDYSKDVGGQKVFGGGENNIAVYSIDENSGEPTLIQHADTHSCHVRTFACDPSGRILVTASIKAIALNDGKNTGLMPAALSVFKIEPDGRLDFVHKYAVDTPGDHLQYWMGIVGVH